VVEAYIGISQYASVEDYVIDLEIRYGCDLSNKFLVTSDMSEGPGGVPLESQKSCPRRTTMLSSDSISQMYI
jgi:hypothetical protein